MPPILVVFAEGQEDIAIKISDKGGGIPRSGVTRLWTYTFTTAGQTSEKLDQIGQGQQTGPPVMAGFAHGLPLSRCETRREHNRYGGALPMNGHFHILGQCILTLRCLASIVCAPQHRKM